jgi:hypothetical protein
LGSGSGGFSGSGFKGERGADFRGEDHSKREGRRERWREGSGARAAEKERGRRKERESLASLATRACSAPCRMRVQASGDRIAERQRKGGRERARERVSRERKRGREGERERGSWRERGWRGCPYAASCPTALLSRSFFL